MPSWSSRRRGALIVVAVTGFALLVGGCTSGRPVATETSTSPPAVAPSPTPTPTPTSTPTVDVTVKPTRPAALDEPPSVDGAVAAAEYFLGLYDYAYATRDLEDWRAISSPNCVFCASVVSNVEAMQVVSHTRVTSGTLIHGAAGVEVSPGAFFTVDVRARQSEEVELNAAGEIVETTPGGEYALLIGVEWANGVWSVREVDVNPASS